MPDAYALEEAGAAWWGWAWSLPQAVAWDSGVLYAAARRAQLEDELAALAFVDQLDFEDLLAGADPDAIARVEWALSTLKRSATGSVALMKEMRELDSKLGLGPKALADLRWAIVADEDLDRESRPPRKRQAKSRAKLRAVDPAAGA